MSQDSSPSAQQPIRPPADGYVYFLRSGEFVKIGYSRDPWARVKHLQTGNPVQSELIATLRAYPEFERHYHELFAAFHVRGEWFRCAPVLLQHVDVLSDYDQSAESWRSFLVRSQEAAFEAVVHTVKTLLVATQGTCGDVGGAVIRALDRASRP